MRICFISKGEWMKQKITTDSDKKTFSLDFGEIIIGLSLGISNKI